MPFIINATMQGIFTLYVTYFYRGYGHRPWKLSFGSLALPFGYPFLYFMFNYIFFPADSYCILKCVLHNYW